MDASLNIAIAAEFDLCEKIAEALEQSELDAGQFPPANIKLIHRLVAESVK